MGKEEAKQAIEKDSYASFLRNNGVEALKKELLETLIISDLKALLKEREPGLVVVPREPTQRMLVAGANYHIFATGIYRAILSAAQEVEGEKRN